MASIVVTHNRLVIRLEGLQRLWGLKRGFEFPLAHVRGATLDSGIFRESKGLKAPGLHVPGYLAIGSFRRDAEWTFWEVKSTDRAVVIELVDERYSRLVLECVDPRGVVDAINEATSARPREGH